MYCICYSINSFLTFLSLSALALSFPLFKRIFHVFCLAERAKNNKIFAAIFPRIFAYYFHCFSNVFTACPLFCCALLLLSSASVFVCVFIYAYTYDSLLCVCVWVCANNMPYVDACFFNLYVPIRLSWILLYDTKEVSNEQHEEKQEKQWKKCLFSCSESYVAFLFLLFLPALPLFNIQYALSSEMEKLCILNANNPER